MARRKIDSELAARIEAIVERPYRKVIRGNAEDGFLIEVPDFPGCMTAGQTEAEAATALPEAMAAWVESNLERGLPIPEPSKEPTHSGRMVIRMPRSLHRRLAERAAEEGVSINQLAVTTIARGLG